MSEFKNTIGCWFFIACFMCALSAAESDLVSLINFIKLFSFFIIIQSIVSFSFYLLSQLFNHLYKLTIK